MFASHVVGRKRVENIGLKGRHINGLPGAPENLWPAVTTVHDGLLPNPLLSKSMQYNLHR